MNNNYLEKLEYNKITETLSTFSKTYLGKELCLHLTPSSNKTTVTTLLDETNEAINFIYKNGLPPLSEIENNSVNIATLEAFGVLSIKSLLDLTQILKISDNLKKYFYVDFIEAKDFPILDSIFSLLYSNNSLVTEISKSIIDENTLADNASSNLLSIRKKQKNISENIKNKLNNFLHSSTYSKYVQENVITIRNSRFVIPVKEEYRSQIKGFIHDVSSSGSTLFIEPLSIFELNNELNNLKIEETIEIEKILQDLTKLFYPHIEELKLNITCIQKLDFIFAKANYAKSSHSIIPKINDNKMINLINAKHPLLDQNIAVPISVNLGNNFNTLVITGPNTGGKTVTLKTIGLLCCMACSGLCIPADETSSLFVFDNIFADIGDDQSIENSLSTFSSHMNNIVKIVQHCSKDSLILVDELGSGTDHVEGSALAISILNYFHSTNCLTVATTHYQELKKFALITNRFENASVEFDVNTLSPTYRLLIGVPGKSNAFEISKKLGLNTKIIANAQSILSENDVTFEELLKNIYDDKTQIENEKKSISKELENIQTLKNSLERDNSKLLEDEKNIINNAKIEARNILLNAKDESNKIISKMNTLSLSNSELNNLRNTLNTNIKNLKINNTLSKSSSSQVLSKDEIKPNVEVFINTLNQNGIILSNISKSNEVQVQIGSIKTSVNISTLEKPQTFSTSTNKTVSSTSHIAKSKTAKSEINIIGLNVEEAIFVVDKFLDDSSLAKLETVRIVHGKGTGKLREGVHKFLRTHPLVKSFRIGTYGEGEMGVTVVELI